MSLSEKIKQLLGQDMWATADNTNWIQIIHETNANVGNGLFYLEINARYIRVEGLQRATQLGRSLFEIQAFGELIWGLSH